MTQQDDITQRVLTDDEIMRSAISACDSLNITRFHEIGAPSKTIMDDAGLLELGRALEGAVLSKLRAPVADERVLVQFGDVGCAGPFPVVDGRIVLSSVTMNDLAYRMASAPVAGEALTAEAVERQYREGVHIGSGLPRATCPCGFCAKHRHGFERGDDLAAPQASECECSRKSKAVSDSEAQL